MIQPRLSFFVLQNFEFLLGFQ
uniref:Uncharacterized protein n=1 Tax=Arundo donax TaxID=35708 RepID=A0A0A9BLG8_ARUDO